MWFIPFLQLFTLLFVLLFGVEMDVGHTLKTRAVVQGWLDASTLAGGTQNQEIVLQRDAGGAPLQSTWVLKSDTSPETVATQTWDKNVGQWNAGVSVTTPPVFVRDGDQKGINGLVNETVKQTVGETFVNKMFGDGSAPDTTISIPLQSTSRLR
jgi:Flp pilus assembly protein TadG